MQQPQYGFDYARPQRLCLGVVSRTVSGSNVYEDLSGQPHIDHRAGGGSSSGLMLQQAVPQVRTLSESCLAGVRITVPLDLWSAGTNA